MNPFEFRSSKSRRRQLRKKKNRRPAWKPKLEPLEPRIVLAAELEFPAANDDLYLRFENGNYELAVSDAVSSPAVDSIAKTDVRTGNCRFLATSR